MTADLPCLALLKAEAKVGAIFYPMLLLVKLT